MSEKNPIHVLNKSLTLYQAPGGFRTSMDSVMLAAACPVAENESILDLGCGVGSAGLCVLKRVPKAKLTGVDIQKDHVELAIQNAKENGFTSKTDFICANIQDLELPARYDHIILNPPYKEAGAHRPSPSEAKARAMGHMDDDIQDWISCAHRHIKGQGSITVIHDAGQTDAIIYALFGKTGGKRFGATEIFPIYPKSKLSAKRVVIRAFKHKKSQTTLHQGIVMHDQSGDYTKEAEAILRDTKRLF